MGSPRSLDPAILRHLVAAWLAEDVGRGDVTTNSVVPPGRAGRARVEAREPCIVAGIEAAATCFELVSQDALEFKALVSDGAEVEAGEVLARIEGGLAPILTAERTALNILGRLCGVATLTKSYVRAVEGTEARILDTRKTTPGLRLLQKYAVAVGGGHNHRIGLDDGVLIKDNHVAAAGGVSEAVRAALGNAPLGLKIEVEVTTPGELDEALSAGAHAILLDNMSPEMVAQAVIEAGGRAVLEVSGGINLETIRSYAVTGVDFISVGALTHSSPTIDLALEIEE
ncbi:MAG: carboxylating nicotinate-nucleotide diphosphorylase [Actinomycetota bacterium]